ncbi:hypothetical protein AVEN_143450-1 [Araneus ventricosus]|uniref:Uncharacterized protein n=1 Tax=Araneus ventricosus TaxID=182803 RepID=A0A4Y2HCK3_ARAVE|nr:hypothetical protein AVEN_143450-1 [Araneus ventricosus]
MESSIGESVKQEIHDKTVPRKWGGSTPHHSNFQPIHLYGSFTEVPCEPLNRPFRSPRTSAPIPPSTFKMESPARFCKGD